MPTLEVGAKAPEFTLRNGNGESVSLKDLRGKKVVLYFYPRDNTSGCTKEACSFRDNITAVAKHNAVVVGVSVDSPDSHRKFAEKFGLPFVLLSDEKKEVVRKYGVWKRRSLYGHLFLGIERTTFVIDEKGVITNIFRKVKVDGHTGEVLSVI